MTSDTTGVTKCCAPFPLLHREPKAAHSSTCNRTDGREQPTPRATGQWYTRIRTERKADFHASGPGSKPGGLAAGGTRGEWPPAPPAPAAPERAGARLGIAIYFRHMPGAGLCLERPPVLEEVGAAAVNFEPRERLVEHMALEDGALGPGRRAQVVQPRLEGEDLVEPLHVPPRDRQDAQLDLALQRIGRVASLGSRKAERHEQGADEDRVGQRVGRRLEPAAVVV